MYILKLPNFPKIQMVPKDNKQMLTINYIFFMKNHSTFTFMNYNCSRRKCGKHFVYCWVFNLRNHHHIQSREANMLKMMRTLHFIGLAEQLKPQRYVTNRVWYKYLDKSEAKKVFTCLFLQNACIIYYTTECFTNLYKLNFLMVFWF